MIPCLDYSHTYINSKGTKIWNRHPFPPDTNAFLYYFLPPEKPRIAGDSELRLRVKSSDDPAFFKSGSDLLQPNDQPWMCPLSILPKHYPPLYEKLKEEGFVPDDLDRKLLTLPLDFPKHDLNRRRLHTLNDTFIVDFGDVMSFLFITEQGVVTLRPLKLFLENRSKQGLVAPFTGAHANLHVSRLLHIDYPCDLIGSALARGPLVPISQDNHTCEVCYT